MSSLSSRVGFFVAALLGLGAQAPKVTLTYFQEHFIVREGRDNESAPLRLPPKQPRLVTAFRRNSVFAVWDERGLSVRVGKKIVSTRLPDIVTSPKAFTRPEIRKTLEEIKKGRRSKNASALSGAIRVANRAFFLARWDDKGGRSWAEALVQVDLSQKFPVPKFLKRPKALSLASAPIDDKLFILDGKISYVARATDHWGLEQFDPKDDSFRFVPLGDSLISFQRVPLPRKADQDAERLSHIGQFVEQTAYGTTVAGRVDLFTHFRKTLAEGRGRMRFVDTESPACVVISDNKTTELLNTQTGAEIEMVVPSSLRRMDHGIVVWTPVDDPKRAWLYDPQRWEGKAWWNSAISPKAGDSNGG